LYRSALWEVFEGHGLRMVSTDAYVLVRAWVPFEEGNTEPDLDEGPEYTFVVSDKDHRGIGLLKYIAKLHKKVLDDDLVPPVVVEKHKEFAGDQGVLEGIEGWDVHLNWPLHATVILPIVDAEFPTWRNLVSEHEPDVADNISLRQPRSHRWQASATCTRATASTSSSQATSVSSAGSSARSTVCSCRLARQSRLCPTAKRENLMGIPRYEINRRAIEQLMEMIEMADGS
jgi:hypothetical protein